MDVKLGEILKKIRRSKKFTQSEVAADLKVSYQQLQKYEKGECGITVLKFMKICDFLKVSPADVLAQIDDPDYITPEPKPAVQQQCFTVCIANPEDIQFKLVGEPYYKYELTCKLAD